MSGRTSVTNPHYYRHVVNQQQHMLEETQEPGTSSSSLSLAATAAATGQKNSSSRNPFAFTLDDDMLDITTDARRDVSDLVDRSQGSKNLMDVSGAEEMNGGVGGGGGVGSALTHYDDFHTIDWLKDLARDRFRHRIIELRRKESLWQQIVTLHDSWSGWICVLLVGLSSGLVAAIVDIGTNWCTHIKEGVCVNAFWLNKPQCCWASKNVTYDSYNNPKCPEVHIYLV